jgi:hypothetical protein
MASCASSVLECMRLRHGFVTSFPSLPIVVAADLSDPVDVYCDWIDAAEGARGDGGVGAGEGSGEGEATA